MADVFLSYVREDVEKVRALAAILERAGHSVWWDRRIKGGAQYSSEIEAALNHADKVVVLWSAKSVGSAWVRDEAAAGRDSGRLVPVSLDSTQPPLGFRQFQTIDLSRWKGRSRAAQLQDLLEAIEERTAAEAKAAPPAGKKRRGLALPRNAVMVLGVFGLALIGGGWWWSTRSGAHTPVVAVDAAVDSPQSQEAARQLAIRLGDVQGTQSDAYQLITGNGDADLVLRVSSSDSGDTASRDLTVLSGDRQSILWATSLQLPRAKADQLSEQLTLISERVLNCALDALSDSRDRIDAPTMKLYVSGCLRLEGLYGQAQYNPELLGSFEQVVAKAPHFEDGWRKLLAAESEIVTAPDPPPALVAKLRGHIARAESLGIRVGEIYLAKAALLAPSDLLGRFDLYRQAIKTDPENPFVYRIHSERLMGVGRMMDAVENAATALQLDPLSPAEQDNYLSALAYAGQVGAAYAQLGKAEAMWPMAQNIQIARYRLDLRYGDPKAALAALQNYPALAGAMRQGALINARIDPTPANVQKAVDAERAVYLQEPRDIEGLLQALAQFGRTDEAIDEMIRYKRPDAIGYNSEVMFRPPFRKIWRDPRSIAGAAHMGLLKYWVKSGKWPDFCSDPTLPYDCRKEAAKYHV
jgi:tetratricopeptide (TPR) repeat protein